ncbi:MAG: hypothetical protein KGD63_08795 [Candidatus Lokiarchaeota archaeon]|nr:hypothetical protein [Candidatus Lokiarchaeota archaeon]
MIYQDFLQGLADIIGAIIGFLKPIVTPIGEFMVTWIEYVLVIFPRENFIVYIVICVILIATAVFVNCYWPGNKRPKHLKDKGMEFTTTENEKIL